MRVWPLLLLASCGAPDRWSASTSYGRSEFTGFEHGERDGTEGALELGISGPLFEPRTRRPDPPPAYQPLPLDEGGIPWTELSLLLAGAGAMKGGEVGYRKFRPKA